MGQNRDGGQHRVSNLIIAGGGHLHRANVTGKTVGETTMSDRRPKNEAHFSLDQASAMLPLLRLIVADICLAHREISERRSDLHRLLRRREGHSNAVYDDEVEETRLDLKTESKQLEDFIRELEGLGVFLRSAEKGIVDFPTRINQQSAFYCWKLNELDISYWHAPNEGFAERKPLPRATVHAS